ncbi:hypothetical protein [Rhizobium sp. ZPR3]|uniref:DUF982 domain-containing protein n=2 Tax=unclassified Rhizobium TaxID=2613769 RepID=A0AAU7SB24_9HYPH
MNVYVALAHDDRLGALTMAVAYWVESMARDDEKADEEQCEEALHKFAEQFTGPQQVAGWINYDKRKGKILALPPLYNKFAQYVGN